MEVVLQSAWSLPITIVFHKYPKYVHPHVSDSIRVTHSHCALAVCYQPGRTPCSSHSCRSDELLDQASC
jgi:hypothetical protein